MCVCVCVCIHIYSITGLLLLSDKDDSREHAGISTLKVSGLIYHCNYHWQENSTTAATNSTIGFDICLTVHH